MGSSNPSSPVGNPYTKKIDYNYDDDGNRTSIVSTIWQQTPTTTGYATNNINEYTSVGGQNYAWDANGNLANNGTLKFKYNYKNLLVEIRRSSDNSLVASYRYDAEGRRVEKAADNGIQRYIYSRVREAEASSVRATNPGSGGRQRLSHVVCVYDDSNNWLQSFVWNDELNGIQMLEQADVLDYDADGNTTEITRSFYHRNVNVRPTPSGGWREFRDDGARKESHRCGSGSRARARSGPSWSRRGRRAT